MCFPKYFAEIIFVLLLATVTSVSQYRCSSKCVEGYNACHGSCDNIISCNNCIKIKEDCISKCNEQSKRAMKDKRPFHFLLSQGDFDEGKVRYRENN